ncbi:unnamed protein product [Cunninghamella blakesleeana]
MTIAEQIIHYIQSSAKKLNSNRNHNIKNEEDNLTTHPIQQQQQHRTTTITIVLDNNGKPITKCIQPIDSNDNHHHHHHVDYKKAHYKKHQTKKSLYTNLQKPFKSLKYPPKSKIIPTSNNQLFQLPSELLVHIVTFLNVKDILTLSSTSHYCYQLCGKKNNYLWQQLFLQHEKQQYHSLLLSPSSSSLSLKKKQPYYYYHVYRDYTLLKKRWQQGQGKSDYLTGHEDSVYCLVWLNDHQVISGSRDKSIKVWDIYQKKCLLTKHHHQGSVLCLTISKDKTFFISGSSDSTLIYWSLPDMEPLKVMEGHLNGVLDCSIVNEKYIVSSSRDATLRVWFIKGNHDHDQDEIGVPHHRLVGHQGPVNALDTIPDTNYVISASGDATLKLWDCSNGHCLKTFVGHQRGLACVKYDAYLNLIISGGQDGKIKLWDIKSTDCLQTLTGHHDLIRTLDTFQGKIISGSYDRTLKVWNGLGGECLLSIQSAHTSWIFNVLINGTKIISAGQDKKMMILNFGYNLLYL